MVLNTLLQIVEPIRNANMVATFVHGDLTHHNVFRTDEQINIIDWGNGGVKPALYDLIMQEFYLASERFWLEVGRSDDLRAYSVHFDSSLDLLLDAIERMNGERLHGEEIRTQIVGSIILLALDSLTRYKTVGEREGLLFFKQLWKITSWLNANHQEPTA